MTDNVKALIAIVLAVSTLSTTLAYLLGLRLGKERAFWEVGVRTGAALDILAMGWDLLDANAKFTGLLANVIDLHKHVHRGAEVWPIKNLKDRMGGKPI